MSARKFLVGTSIASGLAIAASGVALAVTGPAFALQLTTTEKSDIYIRCHKAGGTGKVCCAAAGGIWTPDPKGGGNCDVTGDLRGNTGTSGKAPQNLQLAPSP